MPAAEFSPVTLKKYQKALVERGDARSYINKPIGIIKYMFRWGVSEDLVPVATYQALATVSDLRRGRTKASEAVLRHPVDWDDVKPMLWHVNRTIRDMILVQWHTGCRSGSLCRAQPCQFTRDDNLLLWRPRHKTEYLGREIIIPIGPQCQAVLEPYLDRPPEAFLFNPKQGRNGSNWRYRDHYDAASYRQAVRRGHDAATAAAREQGVAPPRHWTPRQMRHAKATLVRRDYGIEASRVMLGHASIHVTQIYAERDLETAKRIARETG